jgi:hypothetical protein
MRLRRGLQQSFVHEIHHYECGLGIDSRFIPALIVFG